MIEELGRSISDFAHFELLKLSDLDEKTFRERLTRLQEEPRPVLCLIDEVDSKLSEPWPNQAMLTPLEKPRQIANTCFVLVGSGGNNVDELEALIRSRRSPEGEEKGKDILRRVTFKRKHPVPAMNLGDKMLVGLSQLTQKTSKRFLWVEKPVLLYFALHRQLDSPSRIHKSGWVKSNDSRRERIFDRGWLYYIRIEQLSARLAKRDVLAGTKQLIYETVRKHTEIHHQFVRLKDLTREMGMNPKTVADNVREIMDVYDNLKQIEISGDAFYYIDSVLTSEEFETEKKYWETEVSERSTYKNALGHSHEQFCQLAIDIMDEKGDFKISQPWWEFVIKNGKKRYCIYKPSIGDPRRRYEYDRILHIPLSLGKNELVLVFEAKYRGSLGEGYYRYFNEKLADTQGFGCVRKEKDMFGHEVQIRAVRHNIIPVFVIPTVGRDNVDIGRGHLVNFAQYVTIQGCLLVFTQEFERYLQAKFHKNIDFQKQFDM